MNQAPKEGKLEKYVSYALLAIIFVVDCFVSLSFFGGIIYVIGLVLALWFLQPKDVLRVGIFCGIAALVGFFMPLSEVVDNMSGLANRFLAIFVVGAIAILIRRQTDVEEKFVHEQNYLNSVIEKRTTGLKQVVEQFDETKIRLTESEELGNFGFWELHASSKQMTWSDGVFAIYGYPIMPQAPSIQEFLDQTHIDDAQILSDAIEQTLRGRQPSTAEYRITMADGTFKWIYHRGRPILNKEGEVETIVGTIQDVTNTKQSEEKVDINRAKYTTLFKSAAVPKAIFIPNKRILEVNKAFCRWTGYHEKELLKIPIEKLMHKADRSMDDAYAKDIIQGDLDVYRKEKRFVRKNGQVAWGLFCVAAVVDSRNKTLFFSAEILDLNRLKASEEARKQAEESWHEAEEALTEIEAERRLEQQNQSSVTGNPSEELTRELEQAYGMAEEVVNYLFEISHERLAIIGEDGLYKRISPILSHQLGFDNQAMEEESLVSYLHPDEQHVVQGYLDNLFSGQPIPTIPIRHQAADNTYRWFTFEARFNPDHEVAYTVFSPTAPPSTPLQPAAPTAKRTEFPSLRIEEQPEANEPNLPPSKPEQTREPERIAVAPHEEPKPRKRPAREEEYPSLEQHLAQLYGEAMPIDQEESAPYDLSAFDEQPEKLSNEEAEKSLPAPPLEPEPPPQREPIVRTVPSDYTSPAIPQEPLPQAEPDYRDEALIQPDPPLRREEPSFDRSSTPRRFHQELPPIEEPVPWEVAPEPPPPSTPAPDQPAISWRQLTDQMPFMIWMLDTDRQCQYTNKKLRDFTGLPFEELQGSGWSKTLHPEDHRSYVNYCSQIINEQKPVGYTYRMRRASGNYRWMQETSTPLFDANQHFDGYLATGLDISNLKKVGGKFSKALEAALDLEDFHSALAPCQKEECTYAISDSIKVADALISYAAEVPQQDLSFLMRLAGQRLLGLVNGILAFSKVKPKKTELPQRSISLRDIMTTIVDMLAPLRKTNGPRFQVDTQSEDVLVLADKVLLHRVFENLIRGLIDAAESRVIAIDFSSKDNYGVLSISHIGPVLTESFLTDLADLYRDRSKLSLYQRKSGLNISLIQRVIQTQGGNLQIFHDKEIGPVIQIRMQLANQPLSSHSDNPGVELFNKDLRNGEHVAGRPAELGNARDRNVRDARPRVHATHVENKAHRATEVANGIPSFIPSERAPDPGHHQTNGNGVPDLQHDSGRHRLLIGEHNRDTQRLVRSLLQPYYDLTIVSNSEELLKHVDGTKYSLLLLDIHLDGHDELAGVNILQQLRRNPAYKRTPVIAVASGSSGANKSELINRGGFDGFLRKPFSIVELLDTVEKILEN